MQPCEKRLLASSSLSFRIEQLNSHWMDFHKIWYSSILRKSVQKDQVWSQPDKNDGCSTCRPMCMHGNISLSSSRLENVSDKNCTENQTPHFMFNNYFFFWKVCRSWGNVGKYGRAGQATDDSITRLMHINKPTNTHFSYFTLTALPLQQRFHEHAFIWRYTYIACIVGMCMVCRISVSLQCSTFSPQITCVCDFLRHALCIILL